MLYLRARPIMTRRENQITVESIICVGVDENQSEVDEHPVFEKHSCSTRSSFSQTSRRLFQLGTFDGQYKKDGIP